MKKIVKVILLGSLLGLMPAQAQALSLSMPCSLAHKYPRLASLVVGITAGVTLGLSVFAIYKWLSGSNQSVLPNKDLTEPLPVLSENEGQSLPYIEPNKEATASESGEGQLNLSQNVLSETEVSHQELPNIELDKTAIAPTVKEADSPSVVHEDVKLNKEMTRRVIDNSYNAGRNQISSIKHKNGYTAIAYQNKVKILDEQWHVYAQTEELQADRQIRALAFHPHKNIVAIGTGPDRTFSLHVWDIDQNIVKNIDQAQQYHKDTVCFDGITFSPDGNELIVSSDDSLLTFWNTHDWSYGGQLKLDHQHSCLGMSFNSTGELCAVGSADDIFSACNCCFVLDIKKRNIVFKYAFPNELVDKKLQISFKDPSPETQALLGKLNVESSVKDTAIVFHPTQPTWVAISCCDLGTPMLGGLNRQSDANKAIQIIDIQTENVIHTIKNTRGASLLAFNRDGTKIACRNDNSDIEIYDVGSGKKLFDYKRPIEGYFSSILFDDKGNVITGRELYDAFNYDGSKRTLHIIEPTDDGSLYRSTFKHIQAN